MKKIISWVAGSFFRQAGRFLFFIVIGGLIFLLIQHNNIHFKWTDLLGIETVKASSYTTNVIYGSTGYLYQTDNAWLDQDIFYRKTIYPSSTIQRYKLTIEPLSNNADYVEFNFLASQPNTIVSEYQTTEDFCVEWEWKTMSTNEGVTEWQCSRYDTNTNDNKYAKESTITGMNFYFYVDYSDGTWANCETIENNYMMCPTNRKHINGITALINYSNNNSSAFEFKMNRIVNYYVLDNSTSNAINSQTQQQQQQHNETMSTITDTNTTTDSDNTATFFNETNTTSESALTSIVSAPISLINNLVVGSHDSICATLNSKQICLPSGDIIWNRTSVGVHDHWFHGGTLEAFISFFNLVVGGFILYKCLLSLFNSVHKLLDPANSWVGVMKL